MGMEGRFSRPFFVGSRLLKFPGNSQNPKVDILLHSRGGIERRVMASIKHEVMEPGRAEVQLARKTGQALALLLQREKSSLEFHDAATGEKLTLPPSAERALTHKEIDADVTSLKELRFGRIRP